ncbi:MAG: OmpA family protein [Flavobacteriales bacterium]
MKKFILFPALLILIGIHFSATVPRQVQKIALLSFNTAKAESISDLESLYNDLASYKEQIIYIVGHTDSVGAASYNQRLSANRANNIYRFLLKKGFSKKRMIAMGKGEMEPSASNASEEGRAQNRRVEILIESKIDLESPQITKSPEDGCRVMFSGVLMSDSQMPAWASKIWVEDQYSEYVGSGDYSNNMEAFPKAIATTFDGVAIDKGTRVIIYSEPNFKGKILLDVTGPMIINNVLYKKQMAQLNTKAFKEELQKVFPPEKRMWSTSDMNQWNMGSMKIVCGG